MNCSFCSVTAFNGRRYRRRPLESVINELLTIPQKFVMLTDDNIIGYGKKERDWAYDFFATIIKKGIKKFFFAQTSFQFGEDPELIKIASKAGLKIVLIGMESVNEKTLKAFKKELNLKRLHHHQYHELITRIRKGGIAVLGSFIVGVDEDDISTFKSTLNFINSSHIDVLSITKPTPFPGTEFWKSLDGENRIIDNKYPSDWRKYRLTKMVYQPANMSIDEIYEGYTYLRKKYYSPVATLKRTLSTLITTKSLIASIIAYKFDSSYRKAFMLSDHYKSYNNPSLNKKFENIY
jgi:radical SAM superfamily enzyme YgiQ (UPF0313 family)